MDNTVFTTLSTSITGVMDLALTAVIAVCTIVLGSTVGYRMYKRFLG